MSKLSGKMTRKQHWVPRFYLRHFVDSSGQLHTYSRQKSSFLEMIVRHFKYNAPLLEAHLATAPDGYPDSKKVGYLERIRDPMVPLDVDFTWKSIAAGHRTRGSSRSTTGGASRSTAAWKSGSASTTTTPSASRPACRNAPHEGARDCVHGVELWRLVERSTRSTHSI